MGSFFNRKRTSLFLVEPTALTYLSDLPSAGDTAYAGVVMKDGYVYICYYTSDIERDWPWIIGVIAPSDIRIAKINLSNLETVALSPPILDPPNSFKIDGLIFNIGLIGTFVLFGIAIKRIRWSKKLKRN